MTNREALKKARELFGETAYAVFSKAGFDYGMAYRIGIIQHGFGVGRGYGNSWEEAFDKADKNKEIKR